MSIRKVRWILWLGMVFICPVPIFFAVVSLIPVGRLAFLMGLVAGSVAIEGRGPVSDLFLVFSMIQCLVYSVVFWLLAVVASRLLAKLGQQRAAVIAVAVLVCSVLITSVGDVYRTPFNLEAVRTNLVGAYSLPSRRPIQPVGVVEGLPGEAAEATAVLEREPCSDHNPLRNPYFGDTHVHTALSFDAVGQGTRNRPRDAYRFARGEPVGIQPYDVEGGPSRMVQLRRPLDFAMVSDHAELLGETHICFDPDEPGYESYVCWLVRGWPRLAYMIVNGDMFSNDPPKRYRFCGDGGERCLRGALAPWREIQLAAEEAYDRSAACRFTTFVGFEWTGMPGGNNIHRNVVFRNEIVPNLPVNYLDTPTQEGLWDALHQRCLDIDSRCDLIAIPHNSNASNGQLFRVETSDGSPITREIAERRAALEVLVEVTQHKGDSECRRPDAPTADELCAYEMPQGSTLREIMAPRFAKDPAPLSFVREVLAEGVVQAARLGANPFKFGLIGSTDTHLGAPGMVDEDQFLGHAAGPVSRLVETPVIPDGLMLNPGGLAVLWAEENSRESLFEAMRRREAYGTSGPRMIVRVFGGWEYSDDLCDSDDFVQRGYAGGVPMGGDLPPIPSNLQGAAPRFAVWALKDPGTQDFPGVDLQRIQIIKAWEEGGKTHERVYDVAGEPGNGADVDLTTCTPRGPGFDSLCAVWEDPDFDVHHHSVYYGRVVENPSCRWNSYVCNENGVDCSRPGTFQGELAPCCDPQIPKTIQERAWASPIWYTPGEAPVGD